PVLDSESIAYLSQFNFEYLTAGADYDKAVQDSAAFNCDYILSYSTKNNVITNGHLVLAAQGEAFTSIKIRSKVASEGRRYLVIKYALENGATLNDFRFDVIKTEGDAGVGIKYANQCLAGVALPSLSAANPYKAEGNYNYLVVDLALTFGETEISGVDMYISGAGEVLIDEIFYANACEYKLDEETKHVFDAFDSIPAAAGEGALYWWTDISDASVLSIEEGALKIDVAAGTAVCIGGAKPGNNKDWNSRYMVWRMKADNFDMSTFRIAWFDGTTSFANQGAFKTINGAEFILTDEYAEMIIDLDASEISREIEGFRLWLGGWNAEAGSLYIDEIYFADALIQSENAYSASTTLTANDNGYNYICGGDFANTTVAPFVELSFTALNTFKYDTIRVEFQGTDHVEVPASVLNLADPVVLGEGEEAEMRTQTILLNLAAVGITNYADITAVHAHMNAVNVDSEVTFRVRYIDYVPSVKSVALPTNDDSAPAIESAIATTGKVGTEITLSATATDNYDNAVTIAYEVTIGSETVAVSNDKFTPAKAGTYAVKIVATDAAGNTATKVVEIVVASNGNPDPTPNPDPQPGPSSDPQPEGLSAGAIIAIVVASVAVAAGAIVAVVLIRKKKNVK
ncbi:MAG: PKD domain-containing protein, partial [Candidatus Fimimonas sp.]